MRLVITCEHRFSLAEDGSVWTKIAFDCSFWQRYLPAFESVRIAARAKLDKRIDDTYKQVTGPGIEFWPLPFYLGPLQFLAVHRRVRRSLQLAVGNADTLLCRVGSPIADLIIPSFRKENRPYGLEVVVDPNDAMGPGAFRHPLRPFFRIFATKSLKTHCSRAVGVAYVTRERLQRSYPCPAHSVGISDVAQLDFTKTPKVFTTSYSSITSENTEFIDHPRNFAMADCPRILFIGSLAQLYKGPDVLLKAIRMLRPLMRLEVFIVGDGKYRGELEKLAHKLGVSDSIHFLGELPSGVAIRQQLDKATLFVMPSRAEGLPRAMVEAMTRAVPSIGSRVGGIPELLDDQDLVKPGDVNDLAHKIQEVLANPLRLSEMSERNLRRSHEYAPAILNQRRGEFYRFLRKATEQWHGEKQRH